MSVIGATVSYVPHHEANHWPAGVATGVGSMPGESPRESARVVLDALPDLPHLVELPARGPGADMVGRTAGMLVDLHVDLQPSGWRLVDRPGMDERRAASWLDEDLDALEEATQGWSGPLKVQVCGPWTLASTLELPRGDKALADAGAVRDIAGSLAEALSRHVAAVRRRVPGAGILVQLDEPALPAALRGTVRRASGWGRLDPVEAHTVETVLAAVVHAAGVPVGVHCCASEVPYAVLRGAGAVMVSVDAGLLTHREDDALGETLESGMVVTMGLGSPTRDMVSDPAATVRPVRELGSRLGLGAAAIAASVAVSPACGLAGATPEGARGILARCRDAARRLVDDAEV